MPGITIGELKTALQASNARWTVNPALKDEAVIKRRSLGGVPQGLTLAKNIPALNLKAILSSVTTTNPFILERRIANGILPAAALELKATPGGAAPAPTPSGGGAGTPPSGGTHPAKVDW